MAFVCFLLEKFAWLSNQRRCLKFVVRVQREGENPRGNAQRVSVPCHQGTYRSCLLALKLSNVVQNALV